MRIASGCRRGLAVAALSVLAASACASAADAAGARRTFDVPAQPLTRALLGPVWMPFVPSLRILAVAMLLRSFVDLGATLFNAVGEPRLAYRLQAARVAVMAVAIYPLSQGMGGLRGVSLAVLLSLLAPMALCGWALRTTLGVGLRDQLRALVATR